MLRAWLTLSQSFLPSLTLQAHEHGEHQPHDDSRNPHNGRAVNFKPVRLSEAMERLRKECREKERADEKETDEHECVAHELILSPQDCLSMVSRELLSLF